jgi:hypothetical protein
MIKFSLLFTFFILGLIYYVLNCPTNNEEFTIMDLSNLFKKKHSCPNLLIKKDNYIYLYNTNKPLKDGQNPARFNNLEDYKTFMETLKSQNIECPVLELQQTYDTQGERTYKIVSSIDSSIHKPGLPTQQTTVIDTKLYGSHDINSIPGFDPMNQYIGVNTPLDDMFHSKDKISDNPMDTNWGGPSFSVKSVKSGKHAPSEVYKISPDTMRF